MSRSTMVSGSYQVVENNGRVVLWGTRRHVLPQEVGERLRKLRTFAVNDRIHLSDDDIAAIHGEKTTA